MSKRILLYGGAFDPPHLGHEKLLGTAIETVQPDLTLVMPTAVAPHKTPTATPFADRATMARTFRGLSDTVRVSDMERSSRRRKSYTFQTVRQLEKKYPGSEIYLLVGSDMLESFDTWHLYRRLCTRVTMVSAIRSDSDRADIGPAASFIEKLGGTVLLMEFTPIEISSTEIRAHVRAGRTLEGLVSDHVQQVIQKRRLYLDT